MQGVNFASAHTSGPVSLLEVLLVVGQEVLDLLWTVQEADFVGAASSEELNRLSDEGESSGGLRITSLAAAAGQMLEGQLVGSSAMTHQAEVVIESIRGDSWDVYGPEDLLDRFRARYSPVTPLPVPFRG